MEPEFSNLPLEFRNRLELARQEVANARAADDRVELAHALKRLGNIERRPPFMWDVAIKTFEEALALYRELAMPLDTAWVLRQLGIVHEYAERLAEAEACYDESLALFREHAAVDSLDYANTVRYPAVIKNRVGKRDESTQLWEEAARRYDELNLPAGVAEATAWLTIFAIESDDLQLAHQWFAKAEAAASAAGDKDTDKFIAEVKARLENQ